MSRRFFILLCGCLILAAGAAVWHAQMKDGPLPETEPSTHLPEAPAASTPDSPPATPAKPRIAAWQPDVPTPWGGGGGVRPPTREFWTGDAFAPMRAAEVGDAVTLHWPGRPPWSGKVILRHPGEDGLRVGAQAEHETIDLLWGTDGSIRGSVWFTGSAVAWAVSGAPESESLAVEVVPLSRLICSPDAARFPDRTGMLAEMAAEGTVTAGASPEFGAMEESTGPLRVASRPGSPRVIFLDFEGGTVSGTSWNTLYNNGNAINYQASTIGIATQRTTWQRIAEDFAPFDINVTTIPQDFAAATNANRIRVIFTRSSSWIATYFVAGVALLDTFGTSSPSIVWVFEHNIHYWTSLADVASHEAGHAFGLEHHGRLPNIEYYDGAGDWVPIMGRSLLSPRWISQWSRGDYSNANRPDQFDLNVIESKGVPRQPDDHGDTPETATVLVPEAIGDGLRWEPSGLIGIGEDVDVFRIEVPSTGSLWWDIVPERYGPNLTVSTELRRADGTTITAPTSTIRSWSNGATATVQAGTHYLLVSGGARGNPPSSGFSSYGSLGRYRGHIGWNAPRKTHVLPNTALATGNANSQGVVRPSITFTNLSSRASTFTISGSPPGVILPTVTTNLNPGTEGTFQINIDNVNSPVGVNEGNLLIVANGADDHEAVAYAVTVVGAPMQTLMAQSTSFPAVLTTPAQRTLTWTFHPNSAISDAWQVHSVQVQGTGVMSPASATTPILNRNSQPHTLSFGINMSLTPGEYEETLTVTARHGTPGFPKTIPVKFTLPEPEIHFDASPLADWVANYGESTQRQFHFTTSGSAVRTTVSLTTPTPWLAIGSQFGTAPWSFTLSPKQQLPMGLHEAEVVATVVSGMTNPPAAARFQFTLEVLNPAAVVADPPALDWVARPSNLRQTKVRLSRPAGGPLNVDYTLASTIPGVVIQPGSVTLGSGGTGVEVTLTAPEMLPESLLEGGMQVVNSTGTTERVVPLTVRTGPPVAHHPEPMEAVSWSAVTSPIAGNRRGAGIEVHLRGLRTPDAGSLRAVLWPPEGPPVTLLSGAARGSVWDGQNLIITPGADPLPESGSPVAAELRIGPSDHATALGALPQPPTDWPHPPYGRPLEDVLGLVQDGEWRLWLEGTALPGGPLLANGWELVIVQDRPVMRPETSWLPIDIPKAGETGPIQWPVTGTLNEFAAAQSSTFRQSSSVPWIRFAPATGTFSAGSTFFVDGSAMLAGNHSANLQFEGWHTPNLIRNVRMAARTWEPGNLGESRLGPALAVNPTVSLASSAILITGKVEAHSGLEVHLAGLECSELAALELVLVGPDEHRLQLLGFGDAAGPHLGDIRFIDPDHPAAYIASPADTTVRTVTPLAVGTDGRIAGLRHWSTYPPLGEWRIEARWDPMIAGGARIREGWSLRTHALDLPVGAVPGRVWLSAPSGGTGSTVVRFRPPLPGSGLAVPSAADPFLNVVAMGDGLYRVDASPVGPNGNLQSAIHWWIDGDPASPYVTPVAVRVGTTAWATPRGEGRMIHDLGPAIGGPSTIEITGRLGPLKNLRVHIYGLSSPTSNELRAVLEAPYGIGYILFDNVTINPGLTVAQITLQGSGNTFSRTISNEISTTGPQRTSTTRIAAGTEHLHPYTLGLPISANHKPTGIWTLHIADALADGLQSSFAGWDLTFDTDPGYDEWMILHGVGEPTEDTDGDGLTNLEEWYFGTNPNIPVTKAHPSLPVATVFVPFGGGSPRLRIDFRRSVSARRVIDTVPETWSAQHQAWIAAPVFHSQTTVDPDPNFEQVMILFDLPPSFNQFVRLRLTL